MAGDSPLRQGEVLGSSAGSGPRQSPELPRRWRASFQRKKAGSKVCIRRRNVQLALSGLFLGLEAFS